MDQGDSSRHRILQERGDGRCRTARCGAPEAASNSVRSSPPRSMLSPGLAWSRIPSIAAPKTFALARTSSRFSTWGCLRLIRRCLLGSESNDIIGYLLAHPEEDRHLHRAYEKSGYATGWQLELVKSGWQYYLELMRATIERDPAGAASMEEYCRELLRDPELLFVASHKMTLSERACAIRPHCGSTTRRFAITQSSLKLRFPAHPDRRALRAASH